MASKREKSAREWSSSEVMASSRTERNSVKVRWSVCRVRWDDVIPKTDDANAPA